MNNTTKFIIGGALIGIFLGSSTGVVMQGAGYNGAVIFGPLGALIGWLISKKNKEDVGDLPLEPSSSFKNTKQTESNTDLASDLGASAADVFISAFTILATVWNFHIALLEMLRLLPAFQEKPWLFFVLAVVVSAFFPPFSVIYFLCYLGAARFGIKSEDGYRALIK